MDIGILYSVYMLWSLLNSLEKDTIFIDAVQGVS